MAAKKDIYNRDAMIKQEMMAASEVKMEVPDYQEDFEDMIEVQQVQHSGPGHRVKEEVGHIFGKVTILVKFLRWVKAVGWTPYWRVSYKRVYGRALRCQRLENPYSLLAIFDL